LEELRASKSPPMDEIGRLHAIVAACKRLLTELEKLNPARDNRFAEQLRERCRSTEAQLKRLESRLRQAAIERR
jgi:hypothetical protein